MKKISLVLITAVALFFASCAPPHHGERPPTPPVPPGAPKPPPPPPAP